MQCIYYEQLLLARFFKGDAPCAQILAYVNKVREVGCTVDNETFTLEQVEANPVRCPDAAAAELMYKGERGFHSCSCEGKKIKQLTHDY